MKNLSLFRIVWREYFEGHLFKVALLSVVLVCAPFSSAYGHGVNEAKVPSFENPALHVFSDFNGIVIVDGRKEGKIKALNTKPLDIRDLAPGPHRIVQPIRRGAYISFNFDFGQKDLYLYLRTDKCRSAGDVADLNMAETPAAAAAQAPKIFVYSDFRGKIVVDTQAWGMLDSRYGNPMMLVSLPLGLHHLVQHLSDNTDLVGDLNLAAGQDTYIYLRPDGAIIGHSFLEIGYTPHHNIKKWVGIGLITFGGVVLVAAVIGILYSVSNSSSKVAL